MNSSDVQALTAGMDGHNRADVIQAVACVGNSLRIDQQSQAYEQFVTFIKNNSAEVQALAAGMNGEDYRGTVIRMLAEAGKDLPVEDRDDERVNVVTHAKSFISNEMHSFERAWVITALAKVGEGLPMGGRADERTRFVTQAQSLITAGMNGYDRADVIGRLAACSTQERPLYVARALLWCRGLVGNDYMNRLRQVFETRLDRPIVDNVEAAVLAGANPYAAGINVHAGNRDAKTAAAVEALMSRKVDQTDLDNAYQGLMVALGQLKEDRYPDLRDWEAKKQRALYISIIRTLGQDETGQAALRTTGDFGGLLTGHECQITLGGQQYQAQEFLARLWHFAMTYQPQDHETAAENANIRVGILSGLADGLQSDTSTSNHVVCDPGKVQRLITATLQGRLMTAQGLVDVDDTVNPTFGVAAVVVAGADAAAADRITNFSTIYQLLQPRIDDWHRELIQAMARLEAADPRITAHQRATMFWNLVWRTVAAIEERQRVRLVHLDPASVVHMLTLGVPILTFEKDEMKVVGYQPAAIVNNIPQGTVYQTYAERFEYDGTLRLDDYIQARDQQAQAEAERQRVEAERQALIEQQNRDYAETLRLDQLRWAQEHQQLFTEEAPKDDLKGSDKDSENPSTENLKGSADTPPLPPLSQEQLRQARLAALDRQNGNTIGKGG